MPETKPPPPPDGHDSQDSGKTSTLSTLGGCFLAALALAALFIGGAILMFIRSGWTKGRPLRGRWRSRRARPLPAGRPEEAAATHWRRMAVEEQESIATFTELALDLMAAGAPLELVARCHQAALEEAGHARLCLDMARRLDGREESLPAIGKLQRARSRPRWRSALLVRLAVESYVDGCVGEASSVVALGQLARTAGNEELRTALVDLAREESGHARLGEDVVAWSRAAGGPVVERALAFTRARVRRWAAPVARPDDDRNLRDLGVPDDDLRRVSFERARSRALSRG